VTSPAFPSAALALALGVLCPLAGGCAEGAAADDDTSAASEAEIASTVVVADARAIASAVVEEGRIRIPVADGERYRTLAPGAIFVGARGPSGSANTDGFLRRIEGVTEEDGAIVFTTTPATLTDAVVRGGLRATNGGRSFDDHDTREQGIKPLASRRELSSIQIDFADRPLFENVDVVETPEGTARFAESIRLDRAVLTARPNVDVDLAIRDGKITRFVAKVEGDMDSSIKATAVVTAEGDVNAATLAALKSRPHEVRREIFRSQRIPLPTISVGRVPMSPSVQLAVVLRCDLTFGGPLTANAGVEAKSYVRLGAVYANGAWGEPIKSDFDIRPSFAMDRAGEASARCALEAHAELFAYGTSGVSMSVAPYVTFAAQPDARGFKWRASAGATGAMHGRAGVFGVRAEDLERPLAEWTAPSLEGTSP
jgi:hypothetical protein